MERNRVVVMLSALIGLMLLLGCTQVMAACSGCNQTINLTLVDTLDAQTNTPGKTKTSSAFTVARFEGSFVGQQSTSFTNINGSLPPYGTAPSDWVYQRVDDYLSVAVRLSQTCGYIYAPFNRQQWASTTCQAVDYLPATWDTTTWESSLKINRKMIGGTYRKNIFLGAWGGCEGLCAAPTETYANVYLSYNITVPENCELNAGDIVTVDFGKVPTRAFKTAGAKAEGVNPQTRSIALKCSNIEQQASLTMRVEADKVNGNIVVSDNPDVGFVVTDGRSNPLTPNLSTSVIPFKMDSSGRADVVIKTYPASVTGQQPTEGPVSSRAYLRVDFQ